MEDVWDFPSNTAWVWGFPEGPQLHLILLQVTELFLILAMISHLVVCTNVCINSKINYLPTVIIVKRDGLRQWRMFEISPQITLGFLGFQEGPQLHLVLLQVTELFSVVAMILHLWRSRLTHVSLRNRLAPLLRTGKIVMLHGVGCDLK